MRHRTPLRGYDTIGQHFLPGQKQWTENGGLWHSRRWRRPEDPSNPVFDEVYYGWALFEWSKNQLTLVDSALCLEPNTGIIVGSSTIVPIPEPSSFALAALGVTALLRRRHSHRLQGSP